MKAITLLVALVCTLFAANSVFAAQTHHGKHSLGKFDDKTGTFRKHGGLSGVDKQIIKVINSLRAEIRNHEKSISDALKHREEMKQKRKQQLAQTKKEHKERVESEANYNMQRREEKEAEIALKKAEAKHRAAQEEYKRVHKVSTHAISQIDEELKILNRIRELLGVHREGTFKKHVAHKGVAFNKHEDFNAYKNKESTFKNGYFVKNREFVFVEKKKSFHDAEKHCESKGMTLATIRNSDDTDRIVALRKQVGTKWDNPWIGYHDLHGENNFKWVSGSAAKYTNWAPGEPNNLGNEDCTHVLSNGKWNDLKCTNKLNFICEKPMPKKNKYVYFSTKKTFSAARAYCKSKGMTIATIRNAQENALVMQLHTQNNWSGYENSPWIGYHDMKGEKNFRWASGSLSTYTNWAPGEPNNYQNEDCTQILNSSKWNDYECSKKVPFICEAA